MKYLTMTEAAKTLGISRTRLLRAVADGSIPALALGARRLVDVDAARPVVDKWHRDGIGIDALSTATGLCVSAIRKGVRDGWLPYWQTGRWLRFDLDAVCAAIQRRIEDQSKR